MKKATITDRRQFKRYFVKNRVFAVVRSNEHQLDRIENLSKGEIALAVIKSNPPKMGEIVEIGKGGLSFTYIENEADLTQFKEMDILFVDENFHLSRLPFIAVEDKAFDTETPFTALSMKRLNVQFRGLTAKQKRLIKHMLENYTTGEVPIQMSLPSKQVWGSGH